MCENVPRICMIVVYMHMYSFSFPLRRLEKSYDLRLCIPFERIAEMFDISKPRKLSGTAKPAKLSRERAVGGQVRAKSSLAVHPGQALAVNLHPATCDGDRGSRGHRERREQLQLASLMKQANPGSVWQ